MKAIARVVLQLKDFKFRPQAKSRACDAFWLGRWVDSARTRQIDWAISNAFDIALHCTPLCPHLWSKYLEISGVCSVFHLLSNYVKKILTHPLISFLHKISLITPNVRFVPCGRNHGKAPVHTVMHIHKSTAETTGIAMSRWRATAKRTQPRMLTHTQSHRWN